VVVAKRGDKARALAALGIEPNHAPRGDPGVAAPEAERLPSWRDPIERAKVWTNPRTPKAAERASVVSLAVKTNVLTSPQDIAKFPNLARLRLCVLRDEDLPPLLEVAATLEHLVWLRVDWLKERLPPDIGRLRRLRRVEIEGSWSSKRGPHTLPDELFDLPELEELECRDGRLTTLPETIARAKKLVHLDIGGNQPLASLPATWGGLTALRYLDLQRPHALDAASIFPQLAELPSLRALRFRHATIDKLPESIGGLQAIEWLSLGSHLTSLPNAVGNLSTLRALDVEFNDLSALPDSIARLGRLESITLHANPRLDLVQAVGIALECATLRRVLLPATKVPDTVYARLSSAGFTRRKGMYGDPWIRGNGPVVRFRSYA
jgi:hypothetical protein